MKNFVEMIISLAIVIGPIALVAVVLIGLIP